jgi:hypothetical protein
MIAMDRPMKMALWDAWFFTTMQTWMVLGLQVIQGASATVVLLTQQHLGGIAMTGMPLSIQVVRRFAMGRTMTVMA